jgi:hypothetical protein
MNRRVALIVFLEDSMTSQNIHPQEAAKRHPQRNIITMPLRQFSGWPPDPGMTNITVDEAARAELLTVYLANRCSFSGWWIWNSIDGIETRRKTTDGQGECRKQRRRQSSDCAKN